MDLFMADITNNGAVTSSGIRSYEKYLEESRKPANELGKNDFLKLLSVQMQYQDPLEPTKDTEFVAQLAQFSSLEAITNLSNVMTSSYYYSLAGKYVYADVTLSDGTTIPVEGFVDRIVQKDGETYAQIGDKLIKASAISQVYDTDLITSSNPLVETANLIGKSARATIYDEKGNEEKVFGIITRVTVENGLQVAYLDGKTKVSVGNIYDIQDEPFTDNGVPVTEPENKPGTDVDTDTDTDVNPENPDGNQEGTEGL